VRALQLDVVSAVNGVPVSVVDVRDVIYVDITVTIIITVESQVQLVRLTIGTCDVAS
jgi:hypothetical protein